MPPLPDTGSTPSDTENADSGGGDSGGGDSGGGDSGGGDSGGGDTGGADTGAADELYNHVLTTLTVAGRNEGLDLDGDGTVDNAAWIFAAALEAALGAGGGEGSGRVLVVQLAEAESLVDDPEVVVGLVSAEDTDADPSDNASGETFAAGPAVDAEGRAVIGTSTPLSGGAYTAVLLQESLSVGEMTLETATPLHLAGSVTEDRHEGLVGFAISVDQLAALLAEAGFEEESEALAAIADLDTDADGASDALSVALSFDAVACELVQ